MIRSTSVFVAIGATALVAVGAATASARDVVTRTDGQTRVDAPTTRVKVDERTGSTRVKVHAQATRVAVDTDRGLVRIRVPGYSGDIRW
jgi:hypothetical protein